MDEIVIYSSQIFDSHFAKRKEDMNQFCKGSREKSLIMVRLTVRGGVSAPLAVAICKCENCVFH